MNYKQLSSKKLNAMLEDENTTAEQKQAIQQELDSRAQIREQIESQTPAGEKPKAETAPKANKLSEVELHNLAESLKVNLHKRCEVVPFNTVDWVPGYIAGITEDKRAGKVMYAVKCDDGRKIVKVHDSKLIRISDEMQTVVKATRQRGAEPKEAMTPEALAELKAQHQGNIGAVVEFAADKEGTVETGRIMGYMFDARVSKLFYKIAVTIEGEDGSKSIKWVHKVIDSEAIKVMLPLDAEGEAINAKYIERASKERKAPATKEEKLAKLQERKTKLEAQLAELDKQIEALEVVEATTSETADANEDEELA